ncbi:hypothetical protein, conserved [Leishmania shawi]|uniref:Uncharacterized protein n=1 Tax=Leishmania shawi TaxID=5680 RepID=A0ABR3EC42_9TRYP
MQKFTISYLRTYKDGGERSEPSISSRRQPRIVVISSVTVFHLRVPLTEITRLLALLWPSSALTAECGRYYRLYASHPHWPVNNDQQWSFSDVLQPCRFTNMLGLRVHHREGTCRREAEHPSNATISMSKGHYQLDRAGEGNFVAAGRPCTTVTRLASSCK